MVGSSTRRASRRFSNTPRSDPPDTGSAVTPIRATRSRLKIEEAEVETAETSAQSGSSRVSSNSTSSVPTPTRYASEDELSTPPTSNSDTPDSSSVTSGAQPKLPGFQPASSLLRLEIELPSGGPSAAANLASDSVKALSKSKFSINSKRKRDVIEDSEEEDLDDRLARDITLAYKLQKEEDMSRSLPAKRRPSGSKPGPSTLRRAVSPVNSADLIPAASLGRESRLDPDAGAELGARRFKWQRISTGPVEPPAGISPIAKVEENGNIATLISDDDEELSEPSDSVSALLDLTEDESSDGTPGRRGGMDMNNLGTRRQYQNYRSQKRTRNDRDRLEEQHPVLKTMWKNLEDRPVLKAGKADQPKTISRNLKPFQLEGLAWMKAMEKTQWKGGLLGDEMGLGKTIQAVSLIMSDYPAKKPTLVLVPPVALMQWSSEIAAYTDGCLKTFFFHGTNAKTKGMTVKDVKKYDVILMSYNSLESMYRKQEKGFARKEGVYKEKSIIHHTNFHRVILDEAHCIKTRSTMTAKACFALKVDYRWCLTGTPLQNRIGEFFSLLRFLQVEPFSNYICRDCNCSKLEWSVNENNLCTVCNHRGMRHLSVFNQELLNPIQRYGNFGPGKEAFRKLRILTDRVMLRRLKKDHTDSMELPVKEVVVDRQFFSEVETDFANSIMTNSKRKFTTYVENGVMLNNYANIFGLIMQMRQVADHPDLILKKNSEGSQNVLFCCICDEPAEEAIRSKCKHDFCRECAKSYLHATEQPDCPRCHISLSIDLEQPEIEQDEILVKKSSIINRIRMANWTSSSKIELLVHNLYRLRSDKASHKSIIFSQFTTMLQLIEWRLRRAGITTVMLDGSMTPAQRQASIEYFKTNVDVECFLVSLKAGGVALNLTEASRVFIVDPWWNPAAEWQSADRCHRIGQTRPCTVTRLCIEDSVESRMVLLQEKKTRMINSTINSDDAAMESLTPEDLQFLFRGS